MSVEAKLERRYRRLLAWYPVEHRRMYEDEMVGVLLAGARPQQRYPGLREGANLLRSATSMRLERMGAGRADGRWADAAAVVGMLASVLLLGKHVRPVASELGWLLRVDVWTIVPPAATWLRIAVWAVVTVAVLCGWRRVAAIGAAVAVLGEAIVLATRDSGASASLMPAVWHLLLATIAAAALACSTRARRGTLLLGWPRVAVLGVAGVIAAIAPMAIPFLAAVSPPGDPNDGMVPPLAVIEQRWVTIVALLTYAAVAVFALAAIVRIDAPVRRRVLTLLAPTLPLLAVAQTGIAFSFSGAVYDPGLIITGPAYPGLMVAAPLLVLVASLRIVRRRERTAPS